MDSLGNKRLLYLANQWQLEVGIKSPEQKKWETVSSRMIERGCVDEQVRLLRVLGALEEMGHIESDLMH